MPSLSRLTLSMFFEPSKSADLLVWCLDSKSIFELVLTNKKFDPTGDIESLLCQSSPSSNHMGRAALEMHILNHLQKVNISHQQALRWGRDSVIGVWNKIQPIKLHHWIDQLKSASFGARQNQDFWSQPAIDTQLGFIDLTLVNPMERDYPFEKKCIEEQQSLVEQWVPQVLSSLSIKASFIGRVHACDWSNYPERANIIQALLLAYELTDLIKYKSYVPIEARVSSSKVSHPYDRSADTSEDGYAYMLGCEPPKSDSKVKRL